MTYINLRASALELDTDPIYEMYKQTNSSSFVALMIET